MKTKYRILLLVAQLTIATGVAAGQEVTAIVSGGGGGIASVGEPWSPWTQPLQELLAVTHLT